MIIRATLENVEQAAALFDQYRQFYQMPSDLLAAIDFLTKRVKKSDSQLYIAYDSDKPVGFIHVYPGFSSVAMKPIWLVNDLFVLEPARQLGVARMLMSHVHQQAAEQNIFSVKLITAKDNWKAKALYESMGYQLNTTFDSYSKRP